MRPDDPSTRLGASTPPLGPPPTPRGTALLIGLLAAVPVGASYPAASAGFVAGALAARYGVRPFARHLRDWTVDKSPSRVCVPGTDVCLGG